MTKKEIAERAAKTFVQAFVSALLTGLAASGADGADLTAAKKILIPVAISALAAALSAAWNGIESAAESGR